mmetsp:Transcript_11255/g.25198  ORF Transcript_11255/g.25198 Transcript_11255/m.25198 type:complete len:195 (-) Transcript_11255:46-630(-)
MVLSNTNRFRRSATALVPLCVAAVVTLLLADRRPSALDANARVAFAGLAQDCARLRSQIPQESLVARRVRHVGLTSPPNMKSREGAKEYKFDEDGGMYDIIKYPLLTEKACRLLEDYNTYTFLVDRKANKPQIRAAVETIFGVKVKKINTLIPWATYTKRFGRKVGRKSVYKKAYLRLEDGDSIDLFPDDPEQV